MNFLRLSLVALVCLGFAVMLGANTADAQDPISLTYELDPAQDAYFPDTELTVEFSVTEDEKPVMMAPLAIDVDSTGYAEITSVVTGKGSQPDPTVLSYLTNDNGVLALNVIFRGRKNNNGYVRATWRSQEGRGPVITARASIVGKDLPLVKSALIVVRPPVVKSPTSPGRVKVGDTFTQDIVICNAPDLSSWQMNVVFNPSILRVVSVTEGAFLETGETVNLATGATVAASSAEAVDALFLSSAGKGWIPVKDREQGDFEERAANKQEQEPIELEGPAVQEPIELKGPADRDLFYTAVAEGKIALSQARIGRFDPPAATPAVGPNPPLLPGVSSDATTAGVLVTLEFEVLEFAEEPLGIHNVQLVDSENERINYSIRVESMIVVTDKYPAEDVNRDGQVNILDLVLVASNIGLVPGNLLNPPADADASGDYAVQYDSHSRVDVNNDGIVNVLDLIMVASHSAWGEGSAVVKVRDANIPSTKAPAAPAAGIAALTPAAIQGWIDLAQVEDDGSAIFDLGIANLQQMLQTTVPEETRLLLNYPNPFNPETWIPYQLATATDVTVSIYSVNGTLVRTLALGHQAAGVYQSKSQAAYWDGRNELGEQVASGVYFYTLTAGDFSATGKMLVRK